MVVGCGDRLRVVIVKSRHKRTDYKCICFKGLVYGRGLVYPSGDRFKIVDRKAIRVVVTIPTHNIERMCGIGQVMQLALFFDLDQEIAHLIVSLQISRQLEIPLAKWRMFQMLPKPVSIALRGIDRMIGFHYQQAVVFPVKMDLIDHTPGDQEIVSVFKWNLTHECL